mgnify:CR=1 FL=1
MLEKEELSENILLAAKVIEFFQNDRHGNLKMFLLRYGLDGHLSLRTLECVCSSFGCTKENVRQAIKNMWKRAFHKFKLEFENINISSPNKCHDWFKYVLTFIVFPYERAGESDFLNNLCLKHFS